MKLAQMKRGDVLLLQDGSSCHTHRIICLGQATFTHSSWANSSSSNVTHAGVYDGNGDILEASGARGLRSQALTLKDAGSKYQVFRYQNENLASNAAWWAESLIRKRYNDSNNKSKSTGFGRYNMNGLGGLCRSSCKAASARDHVQALLQDPYADRGFYCSNFVCEVYELASKGKSPINVDYRHISPKRLQGELRKANKGWAHVGDYRVS